MLNRLKIGSKIGASFALGLAILSTLGFISYRTTNDLIRTSYLENHTYQVMGSLQDLNNKLQQAETGQRGYIITGEKRYLEPYQAAIESIDQPIKQLRSLTSDNPNQQRRLDILQPTIAERLTVMQQVVNLRQNQGLEAAQKAILSDEGKRLMDRIRNLTDEMKTEENQLLNQRSSKVQAAARETIATITYGIPISFIFIALIGYVLSRNISKPLEKISRLAANIADGDLSANLPNTESQDEVGVLTRSFNQMIVNLQKTQQKNQEQNWLKSNLAQLTNTLQGRRNLATVTELILSKLAPLVGAQHGVIYLMETLDNQPILKLFSSYAYRERKNLANQFRLGESLVGQCALEKQRILLTQVPHDYIRINPSC